MPLIRMIRVSQTLQFTHVDVRIRSCLLKAALNMEVFRKHYLIPCSLISYPAISVEESNDLRLLNPDPQFQFKLKIQ